MIIAGILICLFWLFLGFLGHLLAERKHGKHTELLVLGLFLGPLTFLALRD